MNVQQAEIKTKNTGNNMQFLKSNIYTHIHFICGY